MNRNAPKKNVNKGERLQKVLAAAGYGSRRECELLVLEGRVEVDRKVATELGTRVDLQTQKLRVDGVPVRPPRHFYYVVNKPAGVISTSRDPWARTRVIDLIKSEQRLFTVGRLDRSTTGMILVTNDGELANRLTHPRYGIEKTYLATVAGHPSASALAQIRKGVYLAEGVARVEGLKTKKRQKDSTVLELVLTEGKNREIRRVLARIGHKVLRLQRIAIGPLRLGPLPLGESRKLDSREVAALRRWIEGERKTPRAKKKRRYKSTSSGRPDESKSDSRERRPTKRKKKVRAHLGAFPGKKKKKTSKQKPAVKLGRAGSRNKTTNKKKPATRKTRRQGK